jgi:hypothetical protein
MRSRSGIAPTFSAELGVLEAILVKAQSLGREEKTIESDKEVVAWQAWGKEVTGNFDKAKSAADLKLPPFPEVPSWHRHANELRTAIIQARSNLQLAWVTVVRSVMISRGLNLGGLVISVLC